jgi:hypothetical protein
MESFLKTLKNYKFLPKIKIKDLKRDINQINSVKDLEEIKKLVQKRLQELYSQKNRIRWNVKNKYFDPNLATFSHSAKRRGSKSWLAKIEDESKKYKFNRVFLETMKIDGTRKIRSSKIDEGDLLEWGKNYYTGSGYKQPERRYYLVLSKNEKKIILEKISENRVLELLQTKISLMVK